MEPQMQFKGNAVEEIDEKTLPAQVMAAASADLPAAKPAAKAPTVGGALTLDDDLPVAAGAQDLRSPARPADR